MPVKSPRRATNPDRRRADSLGAETRAALLETAEAMFAEKGIDGVSLRQIGVAAGSANANVVGYHFGTKEALVKATLLRGRSTIEARRAQLLERADRDGRAGDLSALLEALCRPLFEHRNANGRHTYAVFLWHISRSDWWERLSYTPSFPPTHEIIERLSVSLPHLSGGLFMERMLAVADVVTGVLLRLDTQGANDRIQEWSFGHALQMAHAVLAAPCAEGIERTRCRSTTAGFQMGALEPIFGLR